MAWNDEGYEGFDNFEPEYISGGTADFTSDFADYENHSPQMIQPQGRFYGEPSELPYGNVNPYPMKTGIYGTQPQPTVYGQQPPSKTPPNTLGSRPFFVPSGPTTYGGGKIPGQAWGPSGPTGQFMMAPTMGPMPEFKLPVRDESRISSLTQKAAGPGLRELRKAMREAQGRYYENPNVRRMTLRDAMAGYGMGIEKVMAGARREAQAEYEAEFQPQMTKATMEYQAKTNQMLNQYQNAWKEYLYRMGNG